MFRQVTLGASRSASRGAVGVSAELRRDGIEYIQIGGNIGIIGLGAGLTMHLADWIVDCGGSPAFFFDATAAAVRDWAAMFSGQTPHDFAAALKNGLAQVRGDITVLLVNFTSGGTPVDALVKGMLLALRELHWDIPLVVHVAGNSQAAAAQLLRHNGVEPSPRLGDAVRAAVLVSGVTAA
jgi:succinyl-CoA synthetase beta subunit